MKSTELTAEESTNEFAGNGATPLIRLEGVTKVFLTDEVETHALSGNSSRYSRRRIHFDRRTVRLRQDHAVVDSRIARYAFRGQLCA